MDSIGLPYCYECEPIVLIPKFEYKEKKYRELKYIPDFIIIVNNVKYAIEVKGFETPEFKLKWKLLHSKLAEMDIPLEYVVIKSVKAFKEWYLEK
jgi:predicted nuclease of restriction endonuclease-like RecB superfamily